MSRLYLFGILFLLIAPLFGCSSNSHIVNSDSSNELKNENSIRLIELSKKENIEEIDGVTLDVKQEDDNVSQEEMRLLKETLRTYIFDEYMGSSDYGYAKGVNWTANFYDNLTAEEIWDIIEEYKELNNGEKGTLFDQVRYLSVNAPIKDNWEELFLENWNNSPYSDSNEIETMIDKGDSVWIYTDTLPYTGEEDSYPFITLYKRTGFWHG